MKPIENTERRDSVRVEYRLDSVFVFNHDSVFIDRWRSNDTIYITKERWAVRYKDKIVEQRDTIRLTNETVQTVQVKYIPPFYKRCTWALWVLVALVLVWIGFKVKRMIAS